MDYLLDFDLLPDLFASVSENDPLSEVTRASAWKMDELEQTPSDDRCSVLRGDFNEIEARVEASRNGGKGMSLSEMDNNLNRLKVISQRAVDISRQLGNRKACLLEERADLKETLSQLRSPGRRVSKSPDFEILPF
ncbi:hypothetical protein NDN08_007145 [Rhodosorus marinus]|uniref:Uncharacterized protein n=1 Tax=Rhodosorus marinus TaxID=101924 RepID=A0AAV8UJE6_9RHOD|nr:hypothetical protein NDN08_007145 [Rhodosorus marinus]